MKQILIFTALFTITLPLFAAGPSTDTPSDKSASPLHSVSIEINTLGMFGIGVGYFCRFQDVFAGNDISIHAKFSLPLGLALTSGKLDSFKLETGTELDVAIYEGFHMPLYAALCITNQKQVLGSFFSFGGCFYATPGLYLPGGHIAAEAGIDHVFLTRILHSSAVKETFTGRYEGQRASSSPADGTYGNTATRLRLGFSSSLSIGRVVKLYLKGGLLMTPSIGIGLFEGMPFGQFPFYTELGAGFSIP